ncbi:MAG: histidine triad nucleotide-binding protein [Patescibacteria group bacterium]|nr:histidine triad nucleotide-binding protein [Patescibacteria group bacterium]MDD5715712.1 histidine triad nucleotide-binding protein [Patescibacteria group bacterium]
MSDCIFCKVIEKKLPARFIRETDDFIVIPDIAPKAPIHLLLIPKKHIVSLNDASAADQSLLGNMLYAAKQLAQEHGIAGSGYKIVLNTGPDSGQAVGHIHIHLLGGKKLEGIL